MNFTYSELLNNYEELKDEKFDCTSSLGINDYLNTGRYLSSSASGMVFGIGSHKGIPVFIKIFPM
jgi:hypothetical protein